jgi:hypothetical protein
MRPDGKSFLTYPTIGNFRVALPRTGKPLNNGHPKSRHQRQWRSFASGDLFPKRSTQTETGQSRQNPPCLRILWVFP